MNSPRPSARRDHRHAQAARRDAGATGAAARRLRALYAGADPATIAAGRDWYREAAAEVARLARSAPPGIGRVACAGVLAALSPRAQWGQNVAGARAAVAAAATGADPALAAAPYSLGANCVKAARILAGEPADKVLGGRKVRAFWRAILGDGAAVTIDYWACVAAGRGQDANRLTPRRHAVIERAYRAAADWAGETPRDFQAIAWIAARGTVPSDAVVRMVGA